MARVNRKKLPNLTTGGSDIQHPEEAVQPAGEITSATTFTDLFRPRLMMWRTLNCCFQWFTISSSTYSLIFASTTLQFGSPYINFAVVSVVVIPAKLFGIYLFDRQ